MNITKKAENLLMALAIGLIVLACASGPVLLARSAKVPDGVDFSGVWQLRMEPGAELLRRPGSDSRIVIPPANKQRRVESRGSKRSKGSTVHVFLENGELLKISQTVDGLFISFDRAIVEEYTFGENRVISVGPIEAQRVSGWQEDVFVIETLDAQGTLLTESWYIDPANDLLIRDISVSEGDEKQFSARQRFERS